MSRRQLSPAATVVLILLVPLAIPGAVRVVGTIHRSLARSRTGAENFVRSAIADIRVADEFGISGTRSSECSFASQERGDFAAAKTVWKNGVRPGFTGSASPSSDGRCSISGELGCTPPSAESTSQSRHHETHA